MAGNSRVKTLKQTQDSSSKESIINKKNMAGILSYEPPFDHKVTHNFGYVFSVEDASRLRNENKNKVFLLQCRQKFW